ncbi:thioredoxin [Magnetospira thiophila]
MATQELTAENLESTIENNEIVIIDFWADWCGPCKSFAPTYEAMSGKHTDIAFMKCDTEKEQMVAAQFGIRSIPTIGIFREQILIFLQAGALPESALEEIIGKVRELDMDDVRKQAAEQEAAAANS